MSRGSSEAVEATWLRFEVVPARNFALAVSELLRADLRGVEEVLVFDSAYATDGTFRAGTIGVVRSGLDGIIRQGDGGGGEWRHRLGFAPPGGPDGSVARSMG